jgi:hypothetical protein
MTFSSIAIIFEMRTYRPRDIIIIFHLTVLGNLSESAFRMADDNQWVRPVSSGAASDDAKIMTCDKCGGVIEFQKISIGAIVPCPHCKTSVKLKPNKTPGEAMDRIDGIVYYVAFGLLSAGVWCIGHYFWFFSVTNPGETVVNADRLNVRICGVIIGVGMAAIGGITLILRAFYFVFLYYAESTIASFRKI